METADSDLSPEILGVTLPPKYYTYNPKIQKLYLEFVKQTDALTKKVFMYAMVNLETSFDVIKCNAFIDWNKARIEKTYGIKLPKPFRLLPIDVQIHVDDMFGKMSHSDIDTYKSDFNVQKDTLNVREYFNYVYLG